MSDLAKIKYVVGLDIGQSFTGYAFSLIKSPGKIVLNRNWAETFISYRTPTTVVLGTDDKFVHFGYEAYKEYERTIDDDDTTCCSKQKLYRHFRECFTAKADKQRKDCDNCKTNDNTYSIVDTKEEFILILTEVLRYFRFQVVQHLQQHANNSSVNAEDILWVIPVSDWTVDDNLLLVKEAVERAGIVHSLVGASISCLKMYCTETLTKSHFTNCIVIDAGATATRMTVCRKTGGTASSKPIWDVTPPNKQQMFTCSGFERIKHRFIHCIAECCGWSFIKEFSISHPTSWIDIINTFERSQHLSNNTGISFKLSSTFGIMSDLKAAFTKEKDGKQSGFRITPNGSLHISKERINVIFKPVLDEISQIWQKLVTLLKEDEPQVIFLVGGMACSCIVKDHIRSLIGDTVLRIPEDSELCCMKGAVQLGVKVYQRKTE